MSQTVRRLERFRRDFSSMPKGWGVAYEPSYDTPWVLPLPFNVPIRLVLKMAVSLHRWAKWDV